ncbi:hypothetical protein Dsin_007105 [Dipteronia sinensis]|uniref:MADS-box domain-containing protein n=1 Tax=Dipteronia sinensis TaxID=43782 RepID=A0AAE0EG65_9ROSI|nr:hypothetical protein Dsin_007105 [Dipteronia sinensis]
MTRKKVNISWIVKDSARKVSLKKRTVGLLKKVSELSTLCGVEAFVIIYSPDDSQPVMWPTRPEVQEILTRFNNMPEIERTKKMENQETYLKERVSKLEEQFDQQQKKNMELKVSNLMHNVYEGNSLDEMNVTDLESLVQFVNEKRTSIKMKLELRQQASLSFNSLLVAPPSFSHLAPAPDQAPVLVPDQMAPNFGESDYDHHENAPLESSQCEQWFIDIMSTADNIAGCSKRAKTNHSTRLSAYYQPIAASSNSGAETTLGLHPYGDLSGLIISGGIDMPILLSSPPLPFHFGGRSGENDFSIGIWPHHRGSIAPQGNTESDPTRALPSSHFEASDWGNDIALSLKPLENVEIGGNVTSGDMRLPS